MKFKLDKSIKDFQVKFYIKTIWNTYELDNFRDFLIKCNELTRMKVDYKSKIRLINLNPLIGGSV